LLTRLSSHEKTTLTIVFVASVLIWSVLALSIVSLSAHPSAAHHAPPPLSIYAPDPAVQTPTPATLPDPTATATLTPMGTKTPTPTVPPPTPTATRSTEEALLVDDDTVVIALLGIDKKLGAKLWRTDSMILLFIQRREQRLGMLSIPRDLWVAIPGHGHNRINTVDSLGERTKYPGGGPALLDATLRQNLDIRIDHWIRIDFRGFKRIIDAVGGITVDVENPITDKFPDPTLPTGTARITLPAGPHHMDGRMALSYSRSRITTSDFDRSHRQQQVLLALWRTALKPENLIKAPRLWAEFKDSFETDMSMIQAVQLAYVCYGIGLENAHSRHLGYDTTRPWTTPQGAQVLLPRPEAIEQIISDMVSFQPHE